MSKIKDLLAIKEGIDDLMPEPHKYDKAFYDAVQEADIKRIGEHVYQATLHQDDLLEWMRGNANYEAGEDDEGHTEWYFENFRDLCWEACEGTLDADIEEQHLDLTDTEYNNILQYATNQLADSLVDFESECVADANSDNKYTLDELKERSGQC